VRVQRDWYDIAEQPAAAPHLAHPEGCAALRIVLVTVPRVSHSCEQFLDGARPACPANFLEALLLRLGTHLESYCHTFLDVIPTSRKLLRLLGVFSSCLLRSSLELSDTKVYEP